MSDNENPYTPPTPKQYKKLLPIPFCFKGNFPFVENTMEYIDIYDMLSKLVGKINEVIANDSTLVENNEMIYNAFVELTNYVNDYFLNLDIEGKLTDALEAMAELGELQEIITDYINLHAVIGYNDVSELKESTNLIAGSFVRTYGYTTINDGNNALYYIKEHESEVIDEINYIEIENSTLIACLIKEKSVLGFENVNAMKQSKILQAGCFAETYGFYSYGDGGHAKYLIINQTNEVVNGIDIIAIGSDGLIAILINGEYANALQYGIKNDGSLIDSSNIARLFSNKKVYFPAGTYLIPKTIITTSIEIKGDRAKFKPVRYNILNNRYNTIFYSNTANLNITIDGIDFEGYIDVATDSQSGEIPERNSLIEFFNLNNVNFKNCTFKNFDNRYSPEIPTMFIDRRAIICTIQDTNKTYFENCSFDVAKGNELNYMIANTKARTAINAELKGCYFTNILTSIFNFIGNKLYLHENEYNFTYDGSLLNGFALDFLVENEIVRGSFGNVYDNCEAEYFQGIKFTAKNITNYAEITQMFFSVQALNVEIDNFNNLNPNNVNNCLRCYFRGAAHTNHRDCATSNIAYLNCIVSNSDLTAKKCIQSINSTTQVDFTLKVVNCILKTTDTSANATTIYSTPCFLELINNIIYNFVSPASSTPTSLYSRTSSDAFTLIYANGNKIINKGTSAEYFLAGTAPTRLTFIGNFASVSNTIAPSLSYVKAFGNYNYTES